MASLSYLWKNRATFNVQKKAFYKAWAKRILLMPSLIRRNQKRIKLVKSGAYIHETAEIGEVKADGKKGNLIIGAFTFLGKVELALHDKIQIGSYVCINDGVILLTASHDIQDSEWKHKKSPICIDDYAWIATNAIILPGVKIGKGAVVGAGAVVSKDVDPGHVVVGNPAIVTPSKRIAHLNYNPCEFLAANQAWLKG